MCSYKRWQDSRFFVVKLYIQIMINILNIFKEHCVGELHLWLRFTKSMRIKKGEEDWGLINENKERREGRRVYQWE